MLPVQSSNTIDHLPKRDPKSNNWVRLYYALAAFNILAIAISLATSHILTQRYKETVDTNLYWSRLFNEIGTLNTLLAQANAPAKDIFESAYPSTERTRKRSADEAFQSAISQIRAQLNDRLADPERAQQILAKLDAVSAQFRQLDSHAQSLFTLFEANHRAQATAIVPAIEQSTIQVAASLGELATLVRETQNRSRVQEEKQGETLSRGEYLLASSMGLIVIVAIVYGLKMSKHIREQQRQTEFSQSQAQRALHELSSQTFALDQHAIVAITNTAGRIQYVNDRFCQISKYDRAELIGQDHRILNSGHHSKEFFKSLYQTVAKGEVWRGEVKNKAKDGSHYWVDTTVVPYRNEAGHIDRYVAIRADITTRKQAEEDAKKAMRELSSQTFALDQHAIVAITDTAGRIQYVNDRFCQISKYDRDELIGQDHRILNSGHHPPSFFRNLYNTVAKGEVWRGEVKNKAKDGSYYWVDTTVAPYRNEAGRIDRYVAIRADITTRKQAEEDLRNALAEAQVARQAAESASHAKGDFLATMSHEIRTPLNGVIGFSNLLLDSNLTPDSLSYAHSILHSGEALLSIINDILDFSKIEAGKLDLEINPLNLRKIAEEAIDLLSVNAAKKKLELLLRYDPTLPQGFLADPSRIRQIILNLTSNAVKFTKHGHVLIEIGIDPFLPKSNIRISVTDTGIGISPEYQAKLFEKFSQADSSISRNYGGTGLGLAICKRLTELMEGQIGLESSLGKGSTFWISLPLRETELPESPPIHIPDISGRRILIVDDYPLNRTLLTEECRRWGVDCQTAASGLEALYRLKQAQEDGQPYEVVLVDNCMPNMNGKELGTAILNDPAIASAALIIITSASNDSDREEALTIGFSGFFQKPIIKPEQLRNAIADALGIESQSGTVGACRGYATEVAAPIGKFSILVVDDTTTNQSLLRAILAKNYGYSVDIANNGIEALELFSEFQYDGIFMDCMMPIMDGFEATKSIRKIERTNRKPSTPIIALTAKALKGDSELCLAAGMDDYLTKPIDQDKLVAALHRWLPKSKQEHHPEFENPDAPPAESVTQNTYLDLDRIRGKFPNDPQTVSEILTDFQTNLKDLLESCKKGPSTEQLCIIAHKVGGCATECGATELSDIAKRMEQACIDNDLPSIDKLFKSFQFSLKKTLKATKEIT